VAGGDEAIGFARDAHPRIMQLKIF
jgi:hypothetical protein